METVKIEKNNIIYDIRKYSQLLSSCLEVEKELYLKSSKKQNILKLEQKFKQIKNEIRVLQTEFIKNQKAYFTGKAFVTLSTKK